MFSIDDIPCLGYMPIAQKRNFLKERKILEQAIFEGHALITAGLS